MKIQTVTELADRVAQNPDLQEQIKENPVATIASIAEPLRSDVWIYRMVVASLGLTVLIAVIGAIYLANTPSGVPDALLAFGSAAVGALAGLLAPSPK